MTLPMRRTRGGRVHGVEPAALLRREPFADMQELLSRIGGLVQQPVEAEAERPWMPVAEMDETDDAYIVRLELPGIAPAEIGVVIRDRELCVNGEVREEEEGSNALRVRVGEFHYHTSLPSDVDADNVEASMDQGVLTLRIPKAREGQGRRIEVTGGQSEGGQSKGARPQGKRSLGARSS
jgi:HSP20 family protein